MAYLFAAISLGFLGSFHCISMCGPIAMALPVHNKPPLLKYTLILLYNFGRIITYAALGLLAGIIGKSFMMAGLQQSLSVAVGLALLIYVFIPFKQKFSTYPFFLWIKSSFEKVFAVGNKSSLFVIGLLNGLLPCGLVYVGLAGAVASGGLLEGAMFMTAFGIGTLPAMIFIPLASSYITISARNKMQKAIPLAVGVMAIFLILRGLNLGIPYVSPKIDSGTSEVTCHPTEATGSKTDIKCAVPHKE